MTSELEFTRAAALDGKVNESEVLKQTLIAF